MQVITNRLDLDGFFVGLAESQRSLLLLDYDGTLAPFREERNQAVPYPGVVERLELAMASSRTRVVIISGRWSKDLLPLLSMSRPPEIWGCHGIERPDGKMLGISSETAAALNEAEAWAEQNGLSDRSERKPVSLAFHWRGLPEAEAQQIRDTVTDKWPPGGLQSGLTLQKFDGGLELRPAGLSKSIAVRELLVETDDSAPVAYLGDDLTDEDAFEALGDRGLKVLVRGTFRETKADIRIEPPEELTSFLDRWLDCLR
ncbi:MAG: trehalose-phosphatase [bacterium]|nr:trehalose-phosphatase [bacterium]